MGVELAIAHRKKKRTSYLLTPWSRGLPEKLICPQKAKKFPPFCLTRRFITAFTTARHLSLSSTRSIQSMPPTHFSDTHFNIILPYTSGYFKWSPSLRFSHPLYLTGSTCPAQCSLHFITRIISDEKHRV